MGTMSRVPRLLERSRPVPDLDDAGLVHRCLQGNPAAWSLLVARFAPSVRDGARYTLRRVLGSASPEEVENVVQAVFVALCDKNFHRLRLYQARSSFRTWITAVTSRFALNHIRTEKRKGSLKYSALDESAGEIAERDRPAALAADEREALLSSLDRLATRDRLLLKLLYFDGLSYRAIAEILRVPVNSISPLLTRARDELRRLLTPR